MGILDIYFLCLASIDVACMKDDVLGDKNQTLFQSKVFGLGTEIWKIKKRRRKEKKTLQSLNSKRSSVIKYFLLLLTTLSPLQTWTDTTRRH